MEEETSHVQLELTWVYPLGKVMIAPKFMACLQFFFFFQAQRDGPFARMLCLTQRQSKGLANPSHIHITKKKSKQVAKQMFFS